MINKANNQPVAADSITLEGANGEAEYFEVAEGTKYVQNRDFMQELIPKRFGLLIMEMLNPR